MTRDEVDQIYKWLRATYPKRYEKQDQFTETVTQDNLYLAYQKYDPFDVMTAYRHFLEKSTFEPAISEVKAFLAERESRKQEERVNMDDLPEHHYMRGRYVHAEAMDAWQKDQRNGTRNGRTLADYIREYPNIVWRPWAMGPPEHWRGTEYTGWERDENGFIRPKGCKPKYT